MKIVKKIYLLYFYRNCIVHIIKNNTREKIKIQSIIIQKTII
jgi:hypothetical protein